MATEEDPPLVLQPRFSSWRRSSHLASKLYDSGVKLWTKDLLRDIEAQLAQSEHSEAYKLHLVDGTVVKIENFLFGEPSSIWEPRIKYKEYWRLVKAQPDGPHETYLCSYLVDWVNMSARNFRGVIKEPRLVFERHRSSWERCESRQMLSRQLSELLRGIQVEKIICFGLGDMCRKPPEWFTRELPKQPEADFVRDAMIQHSIGLTLADICSSGLNKVDLLAQDPDYTETSMNILQSSGFSVVGRGGAGGFAEINDQTVVFSVCVEAPLKQIVADIARPVLIISDGFTAFNNSEKPWADADSPRTAAMWDQYHKHKFPIAAEDDEILAKFQDIFLYIRKDLGTQ